MKVMLVGSLAESLVNFRGDLLRDLVARGHTVVAAAPAGPSWVREALANWDVRFVEVPLSRAGTSLGSDLKALLALRRVMMDERPDAVLSYTIKPVIYASLAARSANARRVAAMITGLGFAFMPSTSAKSRAVQRLARTLLKAGLARCQIVFFQNADDEDEFRQRALLPVHARVQRINGSGVNLDRFAFQPMPDGARRFLFIGRLLRDKGIREFIEAALTVRQAFPQVVCQVVGPLDANPTSLSAQDIQQAADSGVIQYLGVLRDVRSVLRDSHVLVLPSYREGTPRTVLEAMATGRPALTTDAPGCRDTVEPGVSGWLVPPRDATALADAMLAICRMDDETLRHAGLQARARAQAKYDVRLVNQVLIDTWLGPHETVS